MGTRLATAAGMGFKSIEECLAFQLGVEFKLEVYRVFESSPAATRDFKYKSQLFEAASGVEASLDEGFNRNGAAEFQQFIRYAIGSLAEARRRLRDGIHRKYWSHSGARIATDAERQPGRRAPEGTTIVSADDERQCGRRP